MNDRLRDLYERCQRAPVGSLRWQVGLLGVTLAGGVMGAWRALVYCLDGQEPDFGTGGGPGRRT